MENSPIPVALDECQKAPAIFDRVKLLVDRQKKPGQFLLTGSVRFLSKRQIRESLTGRTVILEMLPMLLGETRSKLIRADLFRTLQADVASKLSSLSSENWASESDILTHLNTGGLPGICFRRDAPVRSQLFSIQLDSILGRDLQSLYASRISLEKLKRLYSEIAQIQGLPVNELDLARKLGTTSPTIHKLIQQYEALFLVRRRSTFRDSVD